METETKPRQTNRCCFHLRLRGAAFVLSVNEDKERLKEREELQATLNEPWVERRGVERRV